jgi:CIC family chloride channel protein
MYRLYRPFIWIAHHLWERLPRFNRHVTTLLLALLIGVLAGYGAVLFRFIIRSIQWLFYQNSGDILEFAGSIPPQLMILLPALGGLIVGLLVHFGAREAKGHGVPEVMEAVALKDGFIRKRVAVVKILASAVCIGSGGSVGREGPIVQIGSSIGSSVAQVFRIPRIHMKTMVGCGAAAGIAATFNAPIAGVLFALEIILADFGLMSFSPVVLASVTATTISRHYFGDLPAFIIPEYALTSLWEFFFYPVLGVLAGLIAIIFTSVIYGAEDLFERIPLPGWLKPALGGAVLGVIFLRFPHVFGVGYGAINLSLVNELSLLLLFLLIWVKIAATSITIGTGGSGGIFAPSLFIGAMTGGAFGSLLQLGFPEITSSSGAYALVAMGGVVAGTTHAPITAILILFELTGQYSVILPLMITCIIATIVASTLKHGSIYTIKLLRRGVHIETGREQNVLRRLKVEDSMNRSLFTIGEGTPLKEIIETFKHQNAPYLHVTNAEGELTGIISFRDIRPILQEEGLLQLIIAKDIATQHLVTVTPEDTLQEALDRMTSQGVNQLPVVTNGKLLGTLPECNITAAYSQALVRREIEAA